MKNLTVTEDNYILSLTAVEMHIVTKAFANYTLEALNNENSNHHIAADKLYTELVEAYTKNYNIENIVGYRVKNSEFRQCADRVLGIAMPKWNDDDKDVYFIRGHIAGYLVAKLRELGVLDMWFDPIYEDNEIKSDWVQPHHLEYYITKGEMTK